MINLPNILASLRIILAPLMLYFFIGRDEGVFATIHYSWLDYIAGFIFVVASITDFFDGYIARKWNQMTKLGAILDPLADKMLMLSAFLGLLLIGRADIWAIYIILTREFFITGLRVVAVADGKEISASFMGKVKTVIQMIAIGFLLMEWPFGNELLILAVLITIYSGYEYVKEFIRK